MNLKHTFLVLVLIFGFYLSANKAEAVFVYTAYDVPYVVTTGNIAPVANAGSDISMCQPQSSRTVSPGSATATDADGVVVSTVWTHVGGTGTSTPIITNATTLTPTMSNMVNVGTYVFRLTATDNGTPPLTGTSNFTVTLTSPSNCPPPTYPDLIASAPTPATATAGTGLTFNSTVTNNSPVTTPPAITQIPFIFQYDNDADHTTVTSTQGGNTIGGPISGNGVSSMSDPHNFGTAGTWYVRGCIDKANISDPIGVVDESSANEGNNCSPWTEVTVSGPSSNKPDLYTDGIGGPSTFHSVGPFDINLIVRNIGQASVGVLFNNRYQLSTGINGTGTVTSFNPITLGPSIGAGGSDGGSSRISFPGFGTFYLRACADIDNVVDEGAGEDNNCSLWWQVTVRPYQCEDSIDNDGDGLKDADDPGCHTDGDPNDGDATYDPSDDDESDPVAPKKQCEDDIDNDADALIDEFDPGCHTDGRVDPTDPTITYNPTDDREKNIKIEFNEN